MLAEFGDDPHRYSDACSRKDYSGLSPITKSLRHEMGRAGALRPEPRLGDALFLQASSALRSSPGARAFYNQAWHTADDYLIVAA